MSLNELSAEEYVERQLELLQTMTVRKDGRWFVGTLADCTFNALVFQTGSQYGINGGRVSKLTVRRSDNPATVINYDRGWDIEPHTDEDRLILDTLVEYFENLPDKEQI